MRIISDFHDYYDCGKRLDNENVPLYLRTQSSYNDTNKYIDKLTGVQFLHELTQYVEYNKKETFYHYFVVGVCGKLYFCGLQYYNEKSGIVLYESDKKFFYEDDFVNRFCEISGKSKFVVEDGIDKIKKVFASLFKELGAPIFCATFWNLRFVRIETNPSLKDIQFFSVKDVYTLWQELDMYLSNMAINQDEPQMIPDEMLAQKKGYNKLSFRRQKKDRAK